MFDPGAMLARFYDLPRGPRVCLRLARASDLRGIEELFQFHGFQPGELDLARLVRTDPRHRIVISATALIGSSEAVVGIGVIDLDQPERPLLVLVDEERTSGLDALLSEALTGRAQALNQVRAA